MIFMYIFVCYTCMKCHTRVMPHSGLFTGFMDKR